MPRWVEKNLDKVRSKVRDAVASAAARVKNAVAAPTPQPTAATGESQPAEPPPDKAAPSAESIDLSKVGGVEGETVQVFRTLFAATREQLETAYLQADDDRIATLSRRLEKTGESLRKHEVAAEARARRNGDILAKSEVVNGITQAVSLLKRLRKQRKKLLRATLADFAPELLDRLDIAVDRISAAEESVFANIKSLPSIEDVALSLDS